MSARPQTSCRHTGSNHPTKDLAILKAQRSIAPPLQLADRAPRVGEVVHVIGNPAGLPLSFHTGSVSGVGKAGELQLDVSVAPGSSGGPVVDKRGLVLGIVYARHAQEAQIGFALDARLLPRSRVAPAHTNLDPEEDPVDESLGFKKGVARVMRRRSRAFQACYAAAQRKNKQLAGRVVVQFTVNKRGRVADVAVVRSTLQPSSVPLCLEKTLKRMSFPKPD